MRGSADRNRSPVVTVPTPRGRVDVMHQEMRGLRKGSGWRTFWPARRAGKRDWVQADAPHVAIRKATLLAPKEAAAVARAGGGPRTRATGGG